MNLHLAMNEFHAAININLTMFTLTFVVSIFLRKNHLTK